jgi:membrane protein implicated in regulation of membrane protease activity
MSLSLRSFHLFFIAVSVLLAVWVGVWGVQSYLAAKSAGDLALGVFFLALGFVLLLYGRRVRSKLPADEDEE